MSVVTSQPPPFGVLKREKHIETLFSSLRGPRRGSLEPQGGLDPLGSGNKISENNDIGLGPSIISGPGLQSAQPKSVGSKEQSQLGIKMYCSGQGASRATPPLPWVQEEMEVNEQESPWVLKLIRTEGPVPLGLQLLRNVDQLHVIAKAEPQDTSCLCLHLCGPARSCCINLYDQNGQEVLHFVRPPRVDACCLGCCLMEIRAFAPNNELIGTVKQRWSMFTPVLEVCDADGKGLMKIQGPCCPSRCYVDQSFQVISTIGSNVAVIWKKWHGFNEVRNMDHEYFGMDVPANMGVNAKALLLAATFLLSHMFFEMS
ncbi:phospholipid scramblase family member 5 [Latimeria chalumnae]|uniref:phospholipid scramblase family member 5 n=1 Tax=Latimeria chalumnae TaxID=7897 RepID=UPI00313D0B0E